MSTDIDDKALAQSWLHSHEEDSGDQVVYRPQGYAFPPSRGRSGFELKSDRTMVEFGPGATERGASQRGRWELQPDGHLELAPSADEQARRTLKIVSVSPTKLVLAKR